MYWFKWVFMWYHLMVCWSGKRAVMCWNAMLVSGEFIFNCRLVENLKILLIKCYEFVLMEKYRKKEETSWLKWNTNWKRMNSITPLQLFTDEERRQKLIISWRGLSWCPEALTNVGFACCYVNLEWHVSWRKSFAHHVVIALWWRCLLVLMRMV